MTAALARRWERRLYTGAHPLVYPLLTGIGKLGPAVRIPGVGILGYAVIGVTLVFVGLSAMKLIPRRRRSR